jgi:hypothetical protein
MKGVVKGSLWGLVLGGTGLSFASLVSEQPNYAQGPAVPQLSVPEFDVVTPGPAIALQGNTDDAPVFAPAAPLNTLTTQTETAPEVSTQPAAQPQTADVAAGIEAPEVASTAGLAAVADAPNAPRVETVLIAPTAEEAAPSVDTAPAAAQPAPVIVEEPSAPVIPEVVVVETPDVPVAQQPAPIIVIEEPQEEIVAEVAPAPVVVEEETTPEVASEVTEPEIAPASEPEVAVIVAPVEEETTAVVTSSENQDAVVITEVLPQTSTAVRINRLTEDDPAPDVETVQAPIVAAIPDDAPALLQFAVPFEQADATALISVVLIDDGQMSDAPAAVTDLGFVPTVVVNALSSSSTALAASYRMSGVEVAMRADLPVGAQPTDVEVAFEAARGLVPEVAMLFSDGTGAMQNRAVTSQVMQILASDGYGFVGVQRGLSNATRAAEQADVPAAMVLRNIDGAGEDARAIARALDQAALRARQTGAAVLLGRITPDTLAVLKTWAADLDQTDLAIAPASAILLRDE